MTLRILELCRRTGKTQTELAEMIGLSRVGLSKAINGNPTIATLEKIANALNVEIWELFTSSTETGDFMALVKNGEKYYHALTLFELEKIVAEIKDRSKEK